MIDKKPDLHFAGFQLWIHGYHSPESKGYWDANWLEITARCASRGAQVVIHGPCLHISELRRWHDDFNHVLDNPDRSVDLHCLEPNLDIEMKFLTFDKMEFKIRITQNHWYQEHFFTFDVDRVHLEEIISDLEAILKAFPLRG